MLRGALLIASLLAASLPSSAQEVGSELPLDFELTELSQTGARSLEDFQGRALLIEFFAYW